MIHIAIVEVLDGKSARLDGKSHRPTSPSLIRTETKPIYYLTQIGGIPETQEMLDYSAANNIYPQAEVIPVRQLDEAYQKDLKVK